jgi:ESS family glutamate:Na+ symporter
MEAVTKKYGPSTKVFLIVPLVGAFFIDVVNAMVIKLFAGLRIIANTRIWLRCRPIMRHT